MRDDTRGPWEPRSEPPFGGGEGAELDMSRVEVEDGGRGRAVDPTARLPRIHDQGVAAVLHFLPVQMAMHDDLVGFDRPLRNVGEIVGEKNPSSADLEAVWRFK